MTDSTSPGRSDLTDEYRERVAKAHGWPSWGAYEASRQDRMHGKPVVRGKPPDEAHRVALETCGLWKAEGGKGWLPCQTTHQGRGHVSHAASSRRGKEGHSFDPE